LKRIPLGKGRVQTMAISMHFRFMAWADEFGHLTLVDLTTGTVKSLPAHHRSVKSLDFSPDDTRLITAGDPAVVLWEITAEHGNTGKETRGQAER
jgi:WD40 repeat protein